MINQNTVDYLVVKQLFEEANQDFKNKEYDQALKKFDQLLDFNLKTTNFTYLQGQITLSGEAVYIHALTYIGEILYLEGNPKEAITYFERLVKEFPIAVFSSKFWVYKAIIHSALKDYVSELLCVDRVLALEPSNVSAIKRKGNCLILVHQDYAQALSYLRSATNTAPNDEEAWFFRADAHLRLHQLAKAEKCLEKVLTINPNYTRAFYVFSLIYFQQKDYLKALQCLKKIHEDKALRLSNLIGLVNKSLEGLVNTGVVFFNSESDKEAEICYQQVHTFIEQFSTTLKNVDFIKCEISFQLALLYSRQNDLSKSLDYFEQASALFNPEWSLSFSLIELWLNKSVIFDALNDVKNRIQCFDEILKIDPKHEQILENKAELLLAQGDYQQGFRLFLQGIELDRDQQKLSQRKGDLFNQMFSQAEAFNKIQKQDDAANCYQLLIEFAGDNVSFSVCKKIVLHNLGEYWRKKNEITKAEECYKKAVSIDPNLQPTWRSLFVLYKTSDNNDEALNCLDQLININPQYIAVFFQKGLIYQQQEKYAEALQMYDQYLQKCQLSLTEDFWLQKSIVHGKLGQTAQQKSCIQKLESINSKHPSIKELRTQNERALMSEAILLQSQSKFNEAINSVLNVAGRYQDAAEFIAESKQLLPNEPTSKATIATAAIKQVVAPMKPYPTSAKTSVSNCNNDNDTSTRLQKK